MTTPFQNLRLHKHADYGLVYGASRKHQSASLSYFYRDRAAHSAAAAASARFGITVPKALGGAPLRNRLKRRIRAAARTAASLLPPEVDIVLHPRPVVATMAYPALQAELAAVFARVAERTAAGAPNTPLPRQPRAGKRQAPARASAQAQGKHTSPSTEKKPDAQPRPPQAPRP